MSPRLHQIILGGLIVTCVGLGGLWLHARTEQRVLQQSISDAQASWQKARRQARLLEHSIAKCTALAAGKESALKENPGAREGVRRTTILRLVEQLKRQHETNPPVPRQKPPPTSSQGMIFLELLSDPEYNHLCFLTVRERFKSTEGGRFIDLGLAPEVREKVFSLLADQYMMNLDRQQLLGDRASRNEGSKLRQAQDQAVEGELRAVMGEIAYQQYTERKSQGDPRSYLVGLAYRLSYTATPLSSSQIDQLASLLAEPTPPRSAPSRALTTDEYIARAGAFLLPSQVEALRQLQAEQQASEKRSRLPKSSELPRNTEGIK